MASGCGEWVWLSIYSTEGLCDHRVSGGNWDALFNDILKLGTWEAAE